MLGSCRCFAGRQQAKFFYVPDLDVTWENLVFTNMLHLELAMIQLLLFVWRGDLLKSYLHSWLAFQKDSNVSIIKSTHAHPRAFGKYRRGKNSPIFPPSINSNWCVSLHSLFSAHVMRLFVLATVNIMYSVLHPALSPLVLSIFLCCYKLLISFFNDCMRFYQMDAPDFIGCHTSIGEHLGFTTELLWTKW